MFETIFQFLFKYPSVAYERGQMALASGWPSWALGLAIALSAAAVGVYLWRMGPKMPRWQGAVVWVLQSLVLAVLLTLLWQPTLVISTVLPQQNVVAVVVDDSASMAMADSGTPRVEQVQETLRPDGPVMTGLREKFQVRTYRFSQNVNRLASVDDLAANGAASKSPARWSSLPSSSCWTNRFPASTRSRSWKSRSLSSTSRTRASASSSPTTTCARPCA